VSAALVRALRHREVLEVYEVRASLERDAARLAARRATEDDVAALRAAPAERDRACRVVHRRFRRHPTLAPYAASRGGIDQLVRTLAAEWAEHHIRVNAVAPGYVATVMADVTAHADPASDRRINTFTPLGRRATVEEIAAPYAFLASPAAGYVTGSVLAVDGGYTAT